jgi:pimeloyl-ACP methyl ester carboxylesterase
MGEYVDVPGGRIYYEVDGSGHPLTLIHAGVAHLRMWDEQVAGFRDSYRVIRYDTRGFGRTITEDVPYANRDDLRRLLDRLGVERTHLLGLSRGAQIALDFAIEQPARVASLVWVAGGVGGHDGPDDGIDWAPIEKMWEEKRWPELVGAETRIWVDGPGQPTDRVEPHIRERMVEWNMENYLAEQPAEQAQPLDPPAAGRLSEIHCPLLVVWGDLDVPSSADAGELLAREVAGARRHVFEGVAHMVNLERPAEFNRLVADFLSSL